MYKLVHTHTKSEIAWHTIQVSPQCQACSKSKERYHNSCNPQKKNKTRHKIKYFCLFEIFQCFLIFFFIKKKNIKNKTTKNRNKTCPQTIERTKSRTSQQHSP